MRRKKKNPETCDEVCFECRSRFKCRKRVMIGYERLAFGSTSDAFRLVMADSFDGISVERLDLYNVSEVKKPKDGAIEIKFFDRIKALEHLGDIPENTDKASAFYEVLSDCARGLEGSEKNEV